MAIGGSFDFVPCTQPRNTNVMIVAISNFIRANLSCKSVLADDFQFVAAFWFMKEQVSEGSIFECFSISIFLDAIG